MRITRIRNDKELGLAKREVELLKEETGTLETELMAVLEQVESGHEASRGGAGGARPRSPPRATPKRRSCATRSGGSAAEIERDRGRRDELVGAVDGDLRRRYEMIFSRRGGVAVVAVRGGTCQGCHMHVPPQLYNQLQRNEQLILCPNCQRMLFWQPEGERGQRVATSARAARRRRSSSRSPNAAGGKSGLRRAGWPPTAAPGDRGKVPQRRDRLGLASEVRVKRRGKSSPGPLVRADAR